MIVEDRADQSFVVKDQPDYQKEDVSKISSTNNDGLSLIFHIKYTYFTKNFLPNSLIFLSQS